MTTSLRSTLRTPPLRPFSRRIQANGPVQSQVTLPGGASAQVVGRAIELRDGEGRLLVRYDGQVTEVSAPAGDLKLVAPQGRVVVEAAGDVVLTAARDVVQHGGRRVDISAGANAESARIEVSTEQIGFHARRAELKSKTARAFVGDVEVFAGRLTTVVKHVLHQAEECETIATRWIQRNKESLREVTDFAEEQLGRAKTVVKESLSVSSRRTIMVSEEDTSIDGRRVLLG